jgi:hypothetical protein
MDSRTVGIGLLLLAGVIAIVGVAVMAGLFGWFGRLPGDIRMEGERVRIYVPLVSMILISVVLTLLVNALRRLL